MKETPRIMAVRELAKKLHGDQTRKDGETPYYTHLYAVAEILSEYTENEDIIIAGLMHDTLEDVKGYTYTDLERDCGANVARIVEGVTQETFPGFKELSLEERTKKFEEQSLRNILKIENGGEGSLFVAAADKIHNLESMMRDTRSRGKDFLDRFKVPISQKLAYYRNVWRAVKRGGLDEIASRLDNTLKEAEEYFGSL